MHNPLTKSDETLLRNLLTDKQTNRIIYLLGGDKETMDFDITADLSRRLYTPAEMYEPNTVTRIKVLLSYVLGRWSAIVWFHWRLEESVVIALIWIKSIKGRQYQQLMVVLLA